jgi:hypothetical protein
MTAYSTSSRGSNYELNSMGECGSEFKSDQKKRLEARIERAGKMAEKRRG